MPEEPTSILVTAAGAEGTAGKITRLRDRGYRVVAADSDPDAPGLYLADSAHVVPPGGDPAFVPELRRICAREEVRAVVPLVDEELLAVWGLAASGIEVLLPRPQLVAVCLDKLLLMETLDAVGVPVPRTRLGVYGADGLGYPLIVKPRTGRGGRGVSVARDKAELDEILAHWAGDLGRVLLQELVEGPEYSASVVVWRDGRVQAVVPKEVVLKDGSSRYAVSRRDTAVIEVCTQAAEALDADGPINVQLCVDRSGVPRVFEINPRFSGSSTLTAASGLDEIAGLLGQALGEAEPRFGDGWREGVAMVRHATETFVPEHALMTRRHLLERSR